MYSYTYVDEHQRKGVKVTNFIFLEVLLQTHITNCAVKMFSGQGINTCLQTN